MTRHLPRRHAVVTAIAGGACIAPTWAAPARAAPAFIEFLFAPSARLWPRWQAHDPAATRVVDHQPWDLFLGRWSRVRADGVRGLDYAGVTADDRTLLAGYIDSLTREPVSRLTRAEQFGLWVNLYNAVTVKVVLDRYPVASIRDITLSGGLFAVGPWSAEVVTVEGQALSLNDIEHRILRPIWRDPRVHYAVNCASVGCPDLRPRAWRGVTLEADLDAAARAYVNHPRGVSAGPDGLTLSSIYNWFSEDFGGEAGVLAHLRRHAEPALARVLDGAPGIRGYGYDWSLNTMAR
jgi:hypothetical protein